MSAFRKLGAYLVGPMGLGLLRTASMYHMYTRTAKSVETTSPQAAVEELDPLIDKRELKQTRGNGKRYQKIASLGSQDQDVYIFCERIPRGAAGDFHVPSSLTRLKSLTRSTPSSKRRGKREVKRLQGAEMANSKGSALR